MRISLPSNPNAKPTIGKPRTKTVSAGSEVTLESISVHQDVDCVKKLPISVKKASIAH